MSEWMSYVLASLLLGVILTLGVGLATAGTAHAQLTAIAATTANEMSVAGGYTLQVQDELLAALQANGFNPALAHATVSPAGSRAPYGSPVSITLTYPVPVRIVDVSPLTVPVASTATAVSLYVPGSPAGTSPLVNPPGAGTGDLQGPIPGPIAPVWEGPS